MKTQLKKIMNAVIMLTILFTGCKKDEDSASTPPLPTNQEEIITTFTIYLTDSANTTNSVSATFRDPDGDGGNAYTQFDTIKLQANKTYYSQLVILNETATPADSISNEILAEANDHLFFYNSIGTNTAISKTDLDSNTPPLPIGLKTKWRTNSAIMGSTQIILKHQPGVKDGTFAPGSTDIDLTFYTKIQ